MGFLGLKKGNPSRERVTVDKAVTTTVDGSYSQKYSYSAEGASLLRTKLVPVPPPAILEERIREVMDAEKDFLAKASMGLMGLYETTRKADGTYETPTLPDPSKTAEPKP